MIQQRLHRKPVVDRTRRTLVGAMSAAAVAGPFLIPKYTHAKRKHRLRILQYTHFVPQYDQWFEKEFVCKWGEENDTEVIVDHVGMTSLNSRARAEVSAGRGHDLFMFLRPPPVYEDHVIDHREIYEECRHRFGPPIDLAIKSTFNPVTKRYYGFSDSYVPDPVNYRADLWRSVGVSPDTWDDIRQGGAEIFRRHQIPIGIGLAPELDSNMALRSILHGFGASVQDPDGRLTLDSPETVQAVKFVRALYRDAMTEEVLTWDPSSNNRLLLAGQGSLTLNAISITRTGEAQKIPVARKIALAPPAAGPGDRVGLMHLMHVYTIWRFAKNIDGAKQFLVDYLGHFRDAFLASRFYNFPCFPQTVPDLSELVGHDTAADPADKYAVLANAADWTVGVGHPGYANAAVDEIFNQWILSRMFAEAARDRMTPQQAVSTAVKEAKTVYDKWRQAGKV